MTTPFASSLLPMAAVLPIAGANLSALASLVGRLLPAIVSIVVMAATTALLCLVSTVVFAGHGSVISHYLGNWGPVHGAVPGIAFAAGPFGMTFALITAAFGTLLLIDVQSEIGGLGRRELGFLICLMQLLLAAIIGPGSPPRPASCRSTAA